MPTAKWANIKLQEGILTESEKVVVNGQNYKFVLVLHEQRAITHECIQRYGQLSIFCTKQSWLLRGFIKFEAKLVTLLDIKRGHN